MDKTNSRIAAAARELAKLLRRRSQLHNESSFASDTLYHVVEAVDQASDGNGLYRVYVQDKLLALRSQFDLKYWPSLSGLVDVIADDALSAEAYASDALTHAATTGPRRASNADFLKALFEAIKERSSHIPLSYLTSG